MKERIAARKEQIMKKINERIGRGGAAAFAATIATCAAALTALGMCGCALERSDPAARSNRATYTLTVTASGEGATATAYVTDGLMATADGEGAITQPSTQTATQSPEFSGAMDPVSAGIAAVGTLGGKAIDAYASKQGDCTGGNCATGDCADGSCTASPCADGDCAIGDCPGGNCGE